MSISINSRTIWILFTATAVICGGAFYLLSLSANNANAPTDAGTYIQQTTDNSHKAAPVPPEGNSTATTKKNTLQQTPYLSENDMHKVDLWATAHGYGDTTPFSASQYSTYNDTTLEKLSLEGDINAMHWLAIDRLRKADLDGALSSFNNAALHGSTHALLAISDLYTTKYQIASTEKEKTEALLTALAYIEVAIKRGDLLSTDVVKNQLKEYRNFYPTEEQDKLIKQTSEKIYAELTAQRADKGLGEFDNTVPPEIEKIVALRKNR